ncbi:MAG: hypothetical protein ACHQEB_02060 [Chitinophagales bacterium]
MKKILFILPVMFFTIALNAQNMDVGVSVGSKYGKYKGFDKNAKENPLNGETTITGLVVNLGAINCIYNKCTTNSVMVKLADGTLLNVGTSDYSFSLPRNIFDKNIIVEGMDMRIPSEKRNPRIQYQYGVQFAASGILVIK